MVDLEALWSVEFVSNLGSFGAGVIVLETERAFGGDSQYYYLGKFKVVHETLQAEITATHFFGQANSVFGNLKQFTVILSGKYAEHAFELQGYLKENPNLKIGVRLKRLALLP
jgi:hypothetical protein